MHVFSKKQADEKIENLLSKSSYLKNEYLDFSQWHRRKLCPLAPPRITANVVNSAIMHIEWEIKTANRI